MIKDSGSRTQFETGAQRDCHEGKGRMDLLPVRALIEVAKVYEEGAKKYDTRNWEKGIPLSKFMDSGLRHAMKWLKGDRDEPHLAQACWNFLCGLDTLSRIEEGLLPVELNDLPTTSKYNWDKESKEVCGPNKYNIPCNTTGSDDMMNFCPEVTDL